MKLIIKDKYNVVINDFSRKVIVSKDVCFGGLKAQYPPATLPLSDDNKIIVRQGNEYKEVNKTIISVQSDMSQSNMTALEYVKQKNKVITIVADDGNTTNGTVTKIITKEYDDAVLYCINSNDGNSLTLSFDIATYNTTFGVNLVNNTGGDITVQTINGEIIDMNNEGQQGALLSIAQFDKITLVKTGNNLIAM